MAETIDFRAARAARGHEPLPEQWDVERSSIQTESQPCADDPLRGLVRLPKLALLGSAAILERAAAPVLYAWQDIAVQGTIVGINGSPSGGKTTLLFLVLVARMAQTPIRVLGRAVTPALAGTWIVLIEGEHGESSTARKLVRSCEILGVGVEALDRVIVLARKAVRVGSPEWAEVQRMVAAGIVSDIALDTIARCAPGDANDEREQVAIFDTIASTIELAPSEATKPVVWSVGHMRKSGEGKSIDDVSGSAQRTGQADSVLLVVGEKVGGQTVSSTVTFIKLREEPDEYPQPTTFAIARDAAGRRRLQCDEDRPGDDEPLELRIMAELALGPRTKSALADRLGRSRQDVDEAISLLFQERRITTCDVKVAGRERKAFAIRDGGSRWEGKGDDR